MIDDNLLLAWGAVYKKIGIGEIIFREDDTCKFYHQLVSGKVKWENIGNDGKECIHMMIDPGESFGELPLFDDGNYAATAVAVEESLLLRLHKPVFLELLKDNPDVHFEVTRLMAKRLRFKFMILKTIASTCPEVRIASLLNYFKSENKNFSGPSFQLELTRQEIADMTGLRVETVIRTMRNMHEKGELVIRKGKVYCSDMIKVIPDQKPVVLF